MKFSALKTSDGTIKIPELILGSVSFGTSTEEKTAFAIMDKYIELGGTAIDTDRIYGAWKTGSMLDSETVVGDWLSGIMRVSITGRRDIKMD